LVATYVFVLSKYLLYFIGVSVNFAKQEVNVQKCYGLVQLNLVLDEPLDNITFSLLVSCHNFNQNGKLCMSTYNLYLL